MKSCAPGKVDLLVTGATGFLGGHLVQAALKRGLKVRALGRNAVVGLRLQEAGADFFPVDLRDAKSVARACVGVRQVVHCGALSSAWGRRRDFYDTNVTGTANVIAGSMENGVERLVHISSPSVLSRFEPQYDLDEEAGFPERFVSLYSETKAQAEELVNQASAHGLSTVILRPKAIYGPGDTAIFPRIIRLLSTGKMPILGDGACATNITHVTDVVQSIFQALAVDEAVGETFLITGGEEVNLWDVIGTIADNLGYARPARQITTAKAMRIGALLEFLWRMLRLPGEPPLTRYKVSVMACSQTYSIDRARKILGYEPQVSWRAGVADFLASLKKTATSQDRKEAKRVLASRDLEEAEGVLAGRDLEGAGPPSLTLFETGATRAWERPFGSGRSWKKLLVPAFAALLDHPRHGPVLFDTGYSTRFFPATDKMPYRIYRWTTPLTMIEDENLVNRLQRAGVSPAHVRWVVISHFDPDHIGGLMDFPNATFLCHHAAWSSVAGKTGLAAMKARLLPGLLPGDFAARLRLLPDPASDQIGPFEHSLDLFGDGLVRLVMLPGHAPGMMGAFVFAPNHENSVFLCADACWSSTAFMQDKTAGIHPLIAHDKVAQGATYEKLRVLRKSMPDTLVIPSHCPEAWERYNRTVKE